jgi:hypothetical protein
VEKGAVGGWKIVNEDDRSLIAVEITPNGFQFFSDLRH